MSVGHQGSNEFVAVLDIDGNDAALADVAVGGEVALLDHARLGGEEDVLVLVPRLILARAGLRLDAHDGGDFLAGFELEKIGDGTAFGGAAHFGDVVGFLDVATALLGEENEVVVRARGEEVFDEIVFLVFGVGLARLHADDALAAAFLGAVVAHCGPLDEAAVGHGDDAAFVGDEILDVDLAFVGDDVGQARAGVFGLNLAQLALDDVENALLAGEDVHEIFDGGEKLFVFAEDLVAFQAGQLIEAEFQDVVDLLFAEEVFAIGQARFAADFDPEFLDLLAGEFEGEEFDFGLFAVFRSADDADKLVEIGQCDEEGLEFFRADFGFAEKVGGAAEDDFAAVLDVAEDGFLERKELRLPVVDGQHRDGEGGLERGVLVEVVDDNLRIGVALEFDHDARFFVRLVADGADVGDRLLVDQIRDALDEGGAVDVVGDLGDDDLLAVALELLDTGFAADFDRAASGFEVLADAADAAELAAGGEVGAFDIFHQAVERDVGFVDLRADGVDDLAQVVRRHVGRHADGDAGAAVDEEVRERGGEDDGFGQALVVVRDEINGRFVHVGHEGRAEVGEARLGVTHGGRRIAFDRAEVALSVDEGFAHGPALRHVDEGRINDRFAVRVVVAARVTADFRALDLLPSGKEPQIVHRVEDAALGGLESVARIGQGAGNDDGHGVVEEGA